MCPEGPEVQIVIDQLINKLKGWKLQDLQVYDVKWTNKRRKMEILLNSELTSISRLGKYIIFTFVKDDSSFYIINHLAMSGAWLFREAYTQHLMHARLSFYFNLAGATQSVDFVDPRKFGRLDFYNQDEFWSEKIQSKLSKLGPDVLKDKITTEIINQRITDFVATEPQWEIKPLLMEQSFLAGIGNIYASEICFLAGVNPFKKATNLTQDEIKQLEEAIPAVIKTAYENGGSTIKTYKNPQGKTGWAERMVYGMKYCRLCSHFVSKGPQKNRTTYWCPVCQAQ